MEGGGILLAGSGILRVGGKCGFLFVASGSWAVTDAGLAKW